MTFKNNLLVFLIIIVVATGVFAVKNHENPGEKPAATPSQPTQAIILGNQTFDLWIADDDTERARGLSGTKNLPENGGMIFLYNSPDDYGFWMKDMLISIDILWFNTDKKLIHVEKNLSPNTYPEIFYPPNEALYIIELPAEKSSELGLQIGDEFEFK